MPISSAYWDNCGSVARGEREIGFRLHGSTLRGCLKSPDSVIFHRLCFPIPASKQSGANPGPRTVSLDLPGLFKHPLTHAPDCCDKPLQDRHPLADGSCRTSQATSHDPPPSPTNHLAILPTTS